MIWILFSHHTFLGFHYINLKNELNQPLLLPSLLVYTEAQDYIPNEHQGMCTTSPTGLALELMHCTYTKILVGTR